MIVVITEVGGTARLVAKYRPQIPVIAATMFKQTAEQLNLHFGLVPYFHTGSPDDVITDTLSNFSCFNFRICSRLGTMSTWTNCSYYIWTNYWIFRGNHY